MIYENRQVYECKACLTKYSNDWLLTSEGFCASCTIKLRGGK